MFRIEESNVSSVINTNLIVTISYRRDTYAVIDSKRLAHPPSRYQHVGHLNQRYTVSQRRGRAQHRPTDIARRAGGNLLRDRPFEHTVDFLVDRLDGLFAFIRRCTGGIRRAPRALNSRRG